MNENIRKLAEQFKMNFSVNGWPQDGIHWDNVDEFAELIVKEATDIAYNMLDKNTGCEVVLAINEHFGVE